MNSNRSDLWNIIVLLKNVIIGFIIAIVLIVAAFVLYLTFSSKDTSTDTQVPIVKNANISIRRYA